MNYTINAAGEIAVLGDRKPEKGEQVFSSPASLKDALYELYPNKSIAQPLLAAHNAIPGVKQVRKFENVEIGLRRTLKACATLGETPAETAGKGRVAKALKGLDAKAKAKATKAAGKGKTKAAAVGGEAGEPREGSKKAQVIAMLETGATRERIQEVTGWQPHSVRGLISTLGKTRTINVTKGSDGVRTYKLEK